jgi:uncharacterized membrane protein
MIHSGRLQLYSQTRLERLARDKHSSLLRKSMNYGFIVQVPGLNVVKLFGLWFKYNACIITFGLFGTTTFNTTTHHIMTLSITCH